ncbi:MAG: hypothetical protein JWO97_2647 [Acidobacteria bacterium]|nr:hypothetical protein [Acidobacteriota bacterium]
MRTIRVAAFVVSLILPALLIAGDSTVTIPLTDFEKIREGQESVSAVVIDTMELGGSFRDAKLSIAFSGRAIGNRAASRVVDGAAAITISGCSGDALITRSAQGAFDLIPLAQSFRAQCELRVSGSDRLQLHAASSVLSVRSTVSDGELLAGDEDAQGGRAWTLVRQASVSSETLAVTATGRYLVTFLPDATRFRYAIDVHNPNRATASLPLKIASGEHVQEIKSQSSYDLRDGAYLFAIAPGDSSIVITGELRGDSFAVPLDATLQYLVIENHPLLRPAATGAAKRVSVAETGVTPTYRGAQAFELSGRERVSWKVTRLEALHTISYAIDGARHTFFLGGDGDILGETIFRINNQGAPDVTLPKEPAPTYAALEDEPLLMTAGKDGRVSVPLSAGEQSLFLQHKQTFRSFAGFGLATIAVPRLPVASSGTMVEIGYPRQWTPLVETFASRVKLGTPEASTMIVFLILALWFERLLARFAVTIKRRVALAITLALATAFAEPFFYVAVLAAALASIIVLSPRSPERWNFARLAAGVAIAVITVIFLMSPSLLEQRAFNEGMALSSTGSGGLGAVSSPPNTYQIRSLYSEMKQAGPNVNFGAPKPPKADAYQGLPARFAMPQPDRQTLFGIPLLGVDRPQQIVVLMLSAALLWWLRAALIICALWLLWRERATLTAAIRARMVEATPPVAEVVAS